MRILKMLLFAAISVVVLGLVLIGVLPSGGHAEASVLIQATPEQVVDQVSDPADALNWNLFSRRDSGIQYQFRGPEKGAGASCSWIHPGDSRTGGDYQITKVIPEKEVDFRIHAGGHLEEGSFLVVPNSGGNGVWIKWDINFHAGLWPWMRFYAISFGSLMEPAMSEALSKLKMICERNAGNKY